MTESGTKALVYCAGGGIGDSLMASLAARALHGRYARVDALTLPAHRETLEHVPDIDEVLVDEGDDETQLARRLGERGYSACVVTWATARTARVAQRARIPVRAGQARRLYSWRFTHRVPVRSELGDVTTHWSQIVLDYTRAIGSDTADALPRFVPTDNENAQAREMLNALNVSKGNFIVLHPTNAIASRRGMWPAGGWASLARTLHETFGAAVLLSGSSEDAAINAAIVRAAADDGVIDIAGKTSIGAFGALARDARFFAGITTGSMHVAAAVGAPTIGIFPFQTDTPERWAPIGMRTAIVRASYPCRPGERKETCPDYACIANLDVPRIVGTAACLLGVRQVR
ncbi:MAG TPA: glycosyltransferase family 9 protein [Candidatus Baltobacteraceae bacterium]|nr:glycosyltransferase family 9 protein [Candidatus Baltobacteraceae bacterium]